ncbi:hypothetical protein DFR70_12426 [Nocardia tenerifensis]|uniref:Uncharacterized protein n=1 Tax=Nocardia tenerifensis TaxID=228006 RepID=A0A318JTM5_9NOCA|nr:hypothetical protein [Nocardia tenerifensis]PXX54585.1 hypothetical protein DFR70_12426 [Nocardia tenerifensis]
MAIDTSVPAAGNRAGCDVHRPILAYQDPLTRLDLVTRTLSATRWRRLTEIPVAALRYAYECDDQDS